MRRDRKGERGFALLLVFAMAAAIAIMMYMELPRAAFEAQRGKEEMLIERGEQYQRGIELYVRKFKKYPRDLDELEKQAGVHFLRQRYKDPLTNSDEWRLVHIDNMGRFTDSLVYKQKGLNDKDKKDYQNTFISEGAAIGTTSVGSSTGVNLANRRRASDAPGAPGTGQQAAEGVSAVTPGSDPNAPPNAEGQAAQPGQQGQPGAVAIDPVTGQPIETPQGQNAAQGQQPAQPGQQPGQPVQQPGQGQPNQLGHPNQFPPVGLPIPGQQPNAAQPAGAGNPNSPQTASNPALQAIQQSLTNPQQAGASAQTGQSGQQAQGAQMGTGVAIPGGLAGVASKLESDSIKIYNDRQKYNEWEFVYDMSKTKGQGQGQGQQGNQNALQPGGSNTPNSSGFGSNSGFGNNSNQNPNP